MSGHVGAAGGRRDRGDALAGARSAALVDLPLGAEDAEGAQELADRAGLHERWVREWAQNQAAAKIVEWSDDDGFRLWLSPEAKAVLADPDHPAFGMGMFHRLPQTMQTLEILPESFRTGIGHDYDSHGPEGAAGIERSFEPWYRNFLVPVGLPALHGVVPHLEAGATVADIGCGAGVAVCLMARAFPASEVHGYDISRYALDRAEQRKADAGLANANFHDVRESALPDDHSIDLITTFDCIHDMTHPQEMMHAIRAALSDEGTWLLVDIKGRDSFAENLKKNPLTSMMYGISVLSCMSSALSEPGGAGLGTLGLPASKAQAMAETAGFTRFRKLDIEHAVNAFYEVRP
jgi:2-polyprenyl-3-methyl-5-hydroxy-6-metoxy-1,4-benzoquinol methylase